MEDDLVESFTSNIVSMADGDSIAIWTYVAGAILLLVITVVIPILITIIYKLLRTPVETDRSKLFFNTFPIPRWMKQDFEKPRTKRVLFLTYGTRGDVQPLVALGQQLVQRGYKIYISTSDSFEQLITQGGSTGIEFVSCGIRSVEQPDFLFDPKQASSFAQVLQVVADVYPALSAGMWHACVFAKPDLIISQAVVRGIGAQCAEKLRIGHWSCHFAPSNTPTREFPPPEYPFSTFGWLNKLKYTHRNLKIAFAAVKTGLSKADNDFRKDVLGLPSPLDPLVLAEDMEREPALHAYSSILQPKPLDWPVWNIVVGAFSLPSSTSTGTSSNLEPPLAAYLDEAKDGEPTVYIGFGSMEGAQEQFRAVVRCIVQALDLRCVICGNLEPELIEYVMGIAGKDSKRIHFVRAAPHDKLFPRCSLIIHHGGAGTTNAAVSAGVPQIVIPILAWSDQPFWANVVERLSVGFRCSGTADEKQLRSRIELCLAQDSPYKRNAAELKSVSHPNGAKAAADLVDRYLDQ